MTVNLCAPSSATSQPVQNLDHLDWRRTPPDIEGYWWLCQSGCKPFAFYVEHLHTERGGWTDQWQCAPVVR